MGGDSCTCVFTRGQAARFWREISAHMPDMMQLVSPIAAKWGMTYTCTTGSVTWNFVRMGNTASRRPFYKKDDDEVYVYWEPNPWDHADYMNTWVMSVTPPSFSKTQKLVSSGCCYMYKVSHASLPPSGTYGAWCNGAWKNINIDFAAASLLEMGQTKNDFHGKLDLARNVDLSGPSYD